jgi:glycosyltransferase involved in cell wall biosynthesis
MWNGKDVSVVLMTYAERDSIREVISGFFATGVVDEVVVVDNNAEPGTEAEVRETPARLVREPRQGYGHATRRGLEAATGDLVVISEPDGTFLPEDIVKLLVYSGECDVVFGTRTTRELIWADANMDWFLRWGNWAVAKLLEFLFNSTNLTDVGCTTRLIRRAALERIQPHFTVGGSSFGPEMMVLTLLLGLKIIQIPVNYLPRVGESAVTGDVRKAFFLGLQMIGLVIRYRVRSWLGWPLPAARTGRLA